MADEEREARRRITLGLSLKRLSHIDALKKEWGLSNRGDVLERLLDDLFEDGEAQGDGLEASIGSDRDVAPGQGELNESAALVLVGRGSIERLEADFEFDPLAPTGTTGPARGGGVDLPGFVSRRSQQLRRSMKAPSAEARMDHPPAPQPRLSMDLVEQALQAASQHWLDLYGTAANATVLESAMVWLARDIWLQVDGSEGCPFTWSAACRLMGELVPDWTDAPPSFERVIVTAGVLEDPFSAATLSLRMPTLIRRFVHRFRRRRTGTSFQTLEHTMTLQGALRLLRLPTDPGHRVTLAQIREAYRELAQAHHPDSGGSLESMRRLNEAYQLLKELYRTRSP